MSRLSFTVVGPGYSLPCNDLFLFFIFFFFFRVSIIKECAINFPLSLPFSVSPWERNKKKKMWVKMMKFTNNNNKEQPRPEIKKEWKDVGPLKSQTTREENEKR
jgi:hypothetical protein